MSHNRRNLFFYLLAICSFLSIANFGHSLIVCDVDRYNPIEVTISEGEFSRLIVQDGAAIKVLFPVSEDPAENYLQGEIEDASATVILKPQQPIKEPITIAVTLDSGLIQNFLVKTDQRKSETILLRSPQEEEINTAPYASSAVQERSTRFLKEFLSGKTPPKGYRQTTAVRSRASYLKKLRIRPIETYQGVHDKVTKYELKNESRQEMNLQESGFSQPNSLWSYLSKTNLKRGEKAILILATKEKRAR